MKFNNKYVSDLLSKDKNIALAAAKHIIETPDIDAWVCFIENSDNIFDFIKVNIGKHFAQVINENNYKNLFKLFKIHSFDWDECFIQIILKYSYSNEELTNKMLDLLKSGSEDEKAYAAKFFSFIPTKSANSYLFEAYEGNYEPLKYNSARALGDAQDTYSYRYYTDKLNSDDDWEVIDAAQFLQWYGNKEAFEKLLLTMDKSSMPEHIAGSVAMLDNISEHFNSSNENIKKLSLDCYQILIDSLAEIWPLSTIIDFNLYNCIEKLITLINSSADDTNKSRYAALLLKTKYQIEMFYNNDEYKFNEDKKTLEEMEGILELLNEGGNFFITSCENLLTDELNSDNDKHLAFTVELIGLLELKHYSEKLKNILLKSNSDEIIFKVVTSLSSLQDFNGLDKNQISAKIKDFNIKYAIEQMMV